jgi:hypothetical protein
MSAWWFIASWVLMLIGSPATAAIYDIRASSSRGSFADASGLPFTVYMTGTLEIADGAISDPAITISVNPPCSSLDSTVYCVWANKSVSATEAVDQISNAYLDEMGLTQWDVFFGNDNLTLELLFTSHDDSLFNFTDGLIVGFGIEGNDCELTVQSSTCLSEGAIFPLGFINEIIVIPERSTWAMMLMGFVGLGYVGYRRRQTLVSATNV